MNVIVYRTGHLGDTICAVPSFRRLRSHFRDEKLVLLCDDPAKGKAASSEIAGRLGIFDRIVTYRSGDGWRTFRDLAGIVKQIRPDIVFSLPQVKAPRRALRKQKLFFRLFGVRKLLGFDMPLYKGGRLLNEPQRLAEILDRERIAGGAFGYDFPEDLTAKKSVRQKLAFVGINEERPYIVFCGGGKTQTQHWPLDRYATVLEQLYAHFGIQIIGIGSPAELSSFKREILPVFPQLKIFSSSLAIGELIELMRDATCYIGNDTGPMHLSAAVGRPVVAIISARNRFCLWDPDIEQRLIFRHRTACEGCWADVCPHGHHNCMRLIQVAEILPEIIDFMKRPYDSRFKKYNS